MAELADALDSGSSGSNIVQVQVLLSALKERRTKRCAVYSLFFTFSQRSAKQLIAFSVFLICALKLLL